MTQQNALRYRTARKKCAIIVMPNRTEANTAAGNEGQYAQGVVDLSTIAEIVSYSFYGRFEGSHT